MKMKWKQQAATALAAVLCGAGLHLAVAVPASSSAAVSKRWWQSRRVNPRRQQPNIPFMPMFTVLAWPICLPRTVIPGISGD